MLYWGAAWLIGLRERKKLPVLSPGTPPPSSPPSVVVVVPARNEEAKIEACIRSLLAQRYPSFTVIAVDDGSTDKTPEILKRIASEHPSLVVKEAGELPDGWRGKCNACWQGVRGVTADWLLFTDADTFHHPDTLAAAMSRVLSAKAEAITLLPHVPCLDFWTRAINPLVGFLLGALYLPTSPDDLRARRPLLNGQYLLIRRGAYERFDGHRRVRNRIVEDLAIAEQMVLYKLPLTHALADQLLTTFMYRGFGETWRGWLKGFYELLGPRPVFSVFSASLLLLTGVLPYFLWLAGIEGAIAFLTDLTDTASGPGVLASFLPALLAIVFSALALRFPLQVLRVPFRYALALPVGSVIVAAMTLYSPILRLLRRPVVWRGRALR